MDCSGRKEDPKEGSYTSYLFDKGLDKILKKVGEGPPGHHRRQGRGRGGDHLRDRRPGLPRDGPDAPAGHLPAGGPGRAGLPPCHRQKGEAGEDDLRKNGKKSKNGARAQRGDLCARVTLWYGVYRLRRKWKSQQGAPLARVPVRRKRILGARPEKAMSSFSQYRGHSSGQPRAWVTSW